MRKNLIQVLVLGFRLESGEFETLECESRDVQLGLYQPWLGLCQPGLGLRYTRNPSGVETLATLDGEHPPFPTCVRTASRTSERGSHECGKDWRGAERPRGTRPA